jgi:hypothetical protein
MIVSSLVVTLDPDLERRTRALAMLACDARLTLGEAIGERLPVVAETASSEAGAQLCEELAACEGVLGIHVVAIDFSAEQA